MSPEQQEEQQQQQQRSTIDDTLNPLIFFNKVGYGLTKVSSAFDGVTNTTMLSPIASFTKGVAKALVVKPMNKVAEIISPQTDEIENESVDIPEDDGEEDVNLEGFLYYQIGKSSKKWKRRYTVLRLGHEDCAIECYKMEKPPLFEDMYSKLNKNKTNRDNINLKYLALLLHDAIPWCVRDVENDSATFVVEIPTTNPSVLGFLMHAAISDADSGSMADSLEYPTTILPHDDEDNTATSPITNSENALPLRPSPPTSFHTIPLKARRELEKHFHFARKAQKPLQLYFKCPRQGNEKALWIKAFSRLERLSPDSIRRRLFMGGIFNIRLHNSRIRDVNANFARETRQLEGLTTHHHRSRSIINLGENIDLLKDHKSDSERREYLVCPHYCYPHRWMTRAELREECNLDSTVFHDMRMKSQLGKEIGIVKMEVLECLGLPKLDRSSDTDAVAYVVMGKYAFATDVIPDTLNPIWPCKARRACIMPIFHGYASLFVGVFDHDGPGKDDFVGRVVIDVARLRPGSSYDVTLPLRLSSHVYTRRKRGAIRIRFSLDWFSEREALTSYLPRSLKFRKEANQDTTVLCTDPTSLRNVVLTVHGAHPPGRFSFNRFRANLKEVNFTRKMVIMLIRLTFQDTITWANPAMSCFVFLAWMHCVYEHSFAKVPAYFSMFIMLHMLRNYAQYGIDGPSQRSFLPPTLEEMFSCLFHGGRGRCISPIEPLVMSTKPVKDKLPGVSDRSMRNRTVETHRPRFKTLFQIFGFLDSPEEMEKMSSDERHFEFPFAPGSKYPKFGVEESLVCRESSSKRKDTAQSSDTRQMPNRRAQEIKRDPFLAGGDEFDEDDDDMDDTFGGMADQSRRYAWRNDDSDYDEDDEEDDPSDVLEDLSDEVDYPPKEELPPWRIVPEQNIDANERGSGKTLTEELAEVEVQMHKLTRHLFHDTAYAIKNPKAVYFGQGKRASNKRKADVAKDIDRLLQVRAYSHSNPLVSRVAVYLNPLVGMCQTFLCVFRAAFNAFTFRDPFLSFWVFTFGWTFTLVLFFIPWRIFLFILGILVVGPQNWVFRKLNEWRTKTKKKPPPKKEEKATNYKLPRDQPLFQGHAAPNTKLTEIDRRSINAKEVHQAVVPYSPLMYQRFYDWPAEPEYSHVRIPVPPKHLRASINKFKALPHSVSTGETMSIASESIHSGIPRSIMAPISELETNNRGRRRSESDSMVFGAHAVRRMSLQQGGNNRHAKID